MLAGIFLTPTGPTFESGLLYESLEQQIDSIEDPLGTGTVMVVGLANSVDYFKQRREQQKQFSSVPMVEIEAQLISIFGLEFGNANHLWSTIRFLLWVQNSYQCQIRDEYGNDWTERYRVEGFHIFYDARLFEAAVGVRKFALVDTLELSVKPASPNYIWVDYDHPELGYVAGFGPDDYVEDEAVAAMSLSFDAAEMRRRLLAQFDSLADPCGTSTVLLAGLPSSVEPLRRERSGHPQQFPACPRIDISAATIRIEQASGDFHQVMSCMRFLVWVLEHHACIIEDGHGNDLTERWAQRGAEAFYEPCLLR